MKSSKSFASVPKKDLVAKLDVDDFMETINKLVLQKEALQNDNSMKVVEISTWIQILQETSMEDIKELFDTLPSTSQFTKDQMKLLQDYHRVYMQLNAYSHFGNCNVCLSEEGDLLLQFTPSSPIDTTDTCSKFTLQLTTTEDNAYTVKGHDFPDSIPVAKLEEMYLEFKYGTDEILKKFTTAIYQYTWPLFNRLSQVVKCENSDITGLSNFVYRNSGLTLMSFTLSVVEENKSMYEFVLKYDPLDIMPYAVSTDLIKGGVPSRAIQESVVEMALEMKTKPFWEVLRSSLGRGLANSRSSQENSESNSDASSSNAGPFEMF